MILVLDASAAVEIVLQRANGQRLFRTIEEAEWILAPTLFVAEVTNVFWKYFRFGNLSMEQCEKAVSVALNLPDEYSDDKTLYKEAFALGCQIGKPIYDMFYLILARRNNGLLMTLDKGLAEAAAKHSVRVLPDVSNP